jgi:fatty acid desaturase
MTEPSNKQDFADRLTLIESMIAEGRSSTESWGWSFVLWGAALYIAIAWSTWGNPAIAWPVTMIVAGLITSTIAVRKARRNPETTLGRSVSSIWRALGISLFFFGLCSGMSHHAEQHILLAAIAVMLGMVNASSSMILRWKLQFGCAVAWWAAAAVSLFGTVTEGSVALLIAIFLCQIVFGIYMMISEARKRVSGRNLVVREGTSHA